MAKRLSDLTAFLSELAQYGAGGDPMNYKAEAAALLPVVARVRSLLESAAGGLRTASETDEGWCSQRAVVLPQLEREVEDV